MPARLIVRDRIEFADDAVAHVTIWQVVRPLRGSRHGFKYRLAYVVKGECVLRYDNEAGKGDHRHEGGVETPYRFTRLDRLLDDFRKDIARWNRENRIV
ncbi:MAG: toxin-antitoxin system TumE family protein [Rhodanobacteraceae bacterium]